MAALGGPLAARAAGAAFLVTGTAMLNALEQSGKTCKPVLLALILTVVGGWSAFAYAAAIETKGQARRALVIGSSALIAVSAFVMKKRPWSPAGIAGFVGGWISLGVALGSSRGGYGLPMSGAAAIVAGTLLLPWQRAACLTDGPALPLVTMGWALVVTSL